MKNMRRKIGVILSVGLMLTMATACGEQTEEKQAHVHTWIEATCTTPKTCSVCGEIEGTTADHTVDIGKCSVCGEIQGKDIVDKISLKIDEASGFEDAALQLLQGANANNAYDKFTAALDIYAKEKTSYEEAYELCASYSELSTLKSQIQTTINKIPLSVSGSDNESLNAFLDDVESLASESYSTQLDFVAVKKLVE